MPILRDVQAGRQDLERAASALATRLPEPLGVFARLAYNYRWAWDPDGPAVFRDIDADRWDKVAENPVRLLQEAAADKLQAARRRASSACGVHRATAMRATGPLRVALAPQAKAAKASDHL